MLKFASNIGLRLVSTIVLTRLLAPEIYGVFAVVMVYLYLLEMLSDIGLRPLILTKEGRIEDDFLRTCWTVSILRGLIIALVSFGIAGIILFLQYRQVLAPENLYNAPDLPWAIATLGGMAFVLGFRSPMAYMHERNMDFTRVTLVFVAVNVFSLVVTVALAIYLRSIWALVLGYAAKNVLQLVLSFAAFPGPAMRLNFDRSHLSLLIGRGKWILGQSILTAVTVSADRLVLGFVMTSSTFGFYYIARQLVDIVSQFLVSVDTQMGLQVFTHLHKSTIEQFRRNYYRYRLFFDALAGLSTGAIVVLAPLLVDIVFDDRYAGVAPIVQILSWSVLLSGPLLMRSALSAERRFKQMTLVSMVSTAMLWIGLFVAIFVYDSEELALMVIALHRLPEAMILIVIGGDRDWVIIWREFLGFAFCAVGIALSWGALTLWRMLI